MPHDPTIGDHTCEPADHDCVENVFKYHREEVFEMEHPLGENF